MELICNYDVGGAGIYSVKWFKVLVFFIAIKRHLLLYCTENRPVGGRGGGGE